MSFEAIALDQLIHVNGGQAPAQQPRPQQPPQYGAPGTSGNPEGRGRTLYQNGSGSQTARDAAHLLEQGGRVMNPFNWGSVATETYEGYRRGGWGGAFLSALGVEH
ncbi:MAG TPA: hypothetical protein VGM39_18420 [Kofleriaceae bacterium]|jgi:hypothetical protein